MFVALPPLAAEPIYHLGSFPITNAYLNSTLALLAFLVLGFWVSRSAAKTYGSGQAPGGALNAFEALVETILGYSDQVTGDRKKSLKFLPIVGALFLFILASNWAGLLPGTGSLFVWGLEGGHVARLPLFRPANTDLNMTLAMAVLAVTASHVFGVAAIGFFKYANRFIKLGDIWAAIKSRKPVGILTAVVEFFVGFIEIFSEVAKMVSLSLRLFGNVFAGEVLLTVLASLIAFFVPLPFIALEILVGLIQAIVFSMLTLVYLNMATEEHGGGHGEHRTEHA